MCPEFVLFLLVAAEIPIHLNSSYQIFIDARINGEAIRCKLDSGGGDRLYLDRARAAKMGIQPTGAGLSSGPGYRQMNRDLRAQVNLEVEGIKLPNLLVLLQDRPSEEFSCNIGQTVFRQFIVEVDYETPALRLHDRATFHYTGPGKTLPLTMDNGSPFVDAVLVTPNGKSFTARVSVDTGGGSPLVMLSKPFVDKNDLPNQDLSVTPDRRFGMDGPTARVATAQFDKLSVGPFDIARPTIHLWRFQGFGGATGPDGLLCSGFLRRFKLFFDYENNSLILEPAK
jgi:hypothetical protein